MPFRGPLEHAAPSSCPTRSTEPCFPRGRRGKASHRTKTTSLWRAANVRLGTEPGFTLHFRAADLDVTALSGHPPLNCWLAPSRKERGRLYRHPKPRNSPLAALGVLSPAALFRGLEEAGLTLVHKKAFLLKLRKPFHQSSSQPTQGEFQDPKPPTAAVTYQYILVLEFWGAYR